MADESPSLHDLIEELGFPPSEHQFLLRLFGSSDPFAGLPLDLEASHSQDQSRQLSSTSLARRLASTRLWQDTPPSSGDFPEDSEGRDLVHYEEEWTSLIGADSESLLSELFQQLATDDEPPCLESPEPPEHHKTSENVKRPGSVEPPCSSVYDSEKGEPPDSVDNLNETPETQGNCEVSQDPRTLNHTGSFKKLLESFPRPPGRDQTVVDQDFSHVYSATQRLSPKDSAQANTSTLTSSHIKSATSLPRISRFSEDLVDSNPIGEQDPSRVCAKADTSALDNTVVNTRKISSQIPSPSPSASCGELPLPDYHEGQQVDPETSDQAQERANQEKYTIFPSYSSRVRPISYVIRKQHSFHSIFEGCSTPTDSPRYYQKTPLRLSTRPSIISLASRNRSTPKRKRILKRFVKKLKHLLCHTPKRTPSAFNH
ncbi:hypothetical protein PROQFM164_S03g001156 [Penicillium roqueforti FM164]|uniref:Uncharacterized protein n=1 Tax=Penicillium roqueforti (strain FM164) TaxID=1365484 RepID=W6QY11_PENRF|nr:hypothetical protein PROQFM164_S03g001156 [Penicillium roqueforti FM164]